MLNPPLKTCRKCLVAHPATLEFFYKHPGGKYGVTPRCKPCVNEDNIASHNKRLAADPAKIRQQGNARSKKHYHKDLTKSRAVSRESAWRARNDFERSLKIKARKRGGGAGLTPEQIGEIRQKQNNLCFICAATDPTDFDHCHSTGAVRFLLCKHCNRGLGAFRDSPEFLRKAADVLERFYDHK